MKRIILLITMSSIITACNTFKGMGQDIQKGGEKLEHVAEGK